MWSIRCPLSSSYRTCSRMAHFTWVDCTDDLLIRNGRGPVCTTSAPTKNYTPTKENEAGKWTTEIKTSRLTPDRIQTCTTRSSLAFSSICHDCGLYMIPIQRQSVENGSHCLLVLSLRIFRFEESSNQLLIKLSASAACCCWIFCHIQASERALPPKPKLYMTHAKCKPKHIKDNKNL